jgi:hypothetical protein
MKSFIPTVIFTILNITLFAQENQINNDTLKSTNVDDKKTLVVLNKANEKMVYISEDAKVIIWINDKRIKGNLKIKTDSIISLNNQEITINQITRIKIKKNTRPVGIVLASVGAISIGTSLYFFNKLFSSKSLDQLATNFLVYASTSSLGTITFFSGGALIANPISKTYFRSKWQYEIRMD